MQQSNSVARQPYKDDANINLRRTSYNEGKSAIALAKLT
jgi:hypothetical protein